MSGPLKSVLILAIFSLSSTAVLAAPKTGATGSFVDSKGNQVGPTLPLPDCRSCKVKQTGPNSYTVTRPKSWKK
jgi:hypothetical protein